MIEHPPLVTSHMVDAKVFEDTIEFAELTRIALLDSIFGKWESILHGKIDRGASNCPLCILNLDCDSCIIFKQTGTDCMQSSNSYKKWWKYYNPSVEANVPTNDCYLESSCLRACDLAVAVQESLISLLSPEDQKNLEQLWIKWHKQNGNVVATGA